MATVRVGTVQTKTETAKIVINDCYGGFGLSDEATREYLRRTGRIWTEERYSDISPLILWSVEGDPWWSPSDIPRNDPVLVDLVEEMGDAANGECAVLEIKELPKGTLCQILEYDGAERIETRDETEWSVA